jgi:hypothetical protein
MASTPARAPLWLLNAGQLLEEQSYPHDKYICGKDGAIGGLHLYSLGLKRSCGRAVGFVQEQCRLRAFGTA